MTTTNTDASLPGSSAGGPPSGRVLNALPTGHRLQEYSLDGILGHGGFGITYLATDHNLDCKVAIKEYLPSDQAVRTGAHTLEPKSDDAVESFRWGLKRFLDEARALATFNHANIVRVLRFFEANATAYMVMELIAGPSLSRWMRGKPPLVEAQLLAIVRPLLEGLHVIHAAGFVHRDIKPGNIHIRNDTVPVLLDFGAARHLTSRTGRELTAIVTPGYAALEQYHTHGNQGPWTDLYSVAALMYNMVTGVRPVEAPARVRNDPLKSALEAADRTRYSEALLRAIDWGLAPEEEKRPQSVAEFARALPGQIEATSALVTGAANASGRLDAAVSIAAPALDAGALVQLEAALAHHLGPMAAVLVRRRAKTSQTLTGLRTALAEDIDNEQSRRLFMERTEALLRNQSPGTSESSIPLRSEISQPSTTVPPPAQFDAAFLAAVEAELAHHLGPLARVLVRKSALTARDRAELFLLLSDHIADTGQRRAFIRKSVAAFKDKT